MKIHVVPYREYYVQCESQSINALRETTGIYLSN